MFKVSKLNPNDRTLDEIHTIQKQIYKEDKGFSAKEEAKRFNDNARKLAKIYNFKIVTFEELKR